MIINLQDRLATEVLQKYAKSHKDQGLTIGLTNGCFDMSHYYHYGTLGKCKRQCDILIVGVDSDRLIRETKGPDRPVFVEAHRVALIDAFQVVDFAFIMDSLKDFEKVSELVQPNFIFKNDAFAGKEDEVVGVQKGTEIIIVRDEEVLSSTSAFINKIRNTKGQINEEE